MLRFGYFAIVNLDESDEEECIKKTHVVSSELEQRGIAWEV